MTARVPADQIETIVGATRRPYAHVARATSAEQTVYILHSHECLLDHADLRECPHSLALDLGINPDQWADHQDRAVLVGIDADGHLVPACLTGSFVCGVTR